MTRRSIPTFDRASIGRAAEGGNAFAAHLATIDLERTCRTAEQFADVIQRYLDDGGSSVSFIDRQASLELVRVVFDLRDHDGLFGETADRLAGLVEASGEAASLKIWLDNWLNSMPEMFRPGEVITVVGIQGQPDNYPREVRQAVETITRRLGVGNGGSVSASRFVSAVVAMAEERDAYDTLSTATGVWGDVVQSAFHVPTNGHPSDYRHDFMSDTMGMASWYSLWLMRRESSIATFNRASAERQVADRKNVMLQVRSLAPNVRGLSQTETEQSVIGVLEALDPTTALGIDRRHVSSQTWEALATQALSSLEQMCPNLTLILRRVLPLSQDPQLDQARLIALERELGQSSRQAGAPHMTSRAAGLIVAITEADKPAFVGRPQELEDAFTSDRGGQVTPRETARLRAAFEVSDRAHDISAGVDLGELAAAYSDEAGFVNEVLGLPVPANGTFATSIAM